MEGPTLGWGTSWRRIPRWSWRHVLSERASLLALGESVPYTIEPDVARLPTAPEVAWALTFYRKSQVKAWCLSLQKFDSKCLEGLAPFDLQAPLSPLLRDRRISRNLRRWRHQLQGLFLEFMTEAECLTDYSFYTGEYTRVPEGWNLYEVPYGFQVEMPTVLRCWGLSMARTPYQEHENSYRRGPLAHCLWSAFFAQWARNVAHALLREAYLRGSQAKLWWISPNLVSAMRSIGCTNLVGGSFFYAQRLEALLTAVEDIRWGLIDPSATFWPARNDVSAPLYRCGDFVPWDTISWRPAIPFDLTGGGPGRCRGDLYTGDLSMYRDSLSGQVTRPYFWKGHEFGDLHNLYTLHLESENAPTSYHTEQKTHSSKPSSKTAKKVHELSQSFSELTDDKKFGRNTFKRQRESLFFSNASDSFVAQVPKTHFETFISRFDGPESVEEPDDTSNPIKRHTSVQENYNGSLDFIDVSTEIAVRDVSLDVQNTHCISYYFDSAVDRALRQARWAQEEVQVVDASSEVLHSAVKLFDTKSVSDTEMINVMTDVFTDRRVHKLFTLMGCSPLHSNDLRNEPEYTVRDIVRATFTDVANTATEPEHGRGHTRREAALQMLRFIYWASRELSIRCISSSGV